MLTSQRTSNSDEELVYEGVNFLLAKEDPPNEPIKMGLIRMSDSDEEQDHGTIKVEPIKMSDSDEGPHCERVNFVRAGVEQEPVLVKFRPIKSEQDSASQVRNRDEPYSRDIECEGRRGRKLS